MECWHELKLSQIVINCAVNVDCFVDWVFKMLVVLDEGVVYRFRMVLWCIWRQRNNKLWNDVIDSAKKSVYSAMEY